MNFNPFWLVWLLIRNKKHENLKILKISVGYTFMKLGRQITPTFDFCGPRTSIAIRLLRFTLILNSLSLILTNEEKIKEENIKCVNNLHGKESVIGR